MIYEDLVEQSADFLRKGKIPQAVSTLERCLAVNLDDPLVLFLLGAGYQSQKYLGTAISHLRRAVEIRPEMDMAWHNLGVCYRMAEYYDLAEGAYRKALEIDPDRADTLAMLAGAFINVGNPGPGILYARQSLELEDSPHAHNHLALALLETGAWKEGWKEYEHRWSVPERAQHIRDYGDVPKWDGRSLDGTLVIHGEQGLGDEILYMSLFHEIKAEHVVIECAPRLVDLFERSFGVQCYGTHEALMEDMWPGDEIAAWLPMGDLPRLFRNTDDSFDGQKPFLAPSPERVEKWRAKLDETGPGPHIGLAWYGGNQATHQSLRCVPLDKWAPILENDATFVSVQYGVKEAQIPHWNPDDFDELTALIQACDLVITVNQTAVHQAGGLGKECWTLTPKACAWRYAPGGDKMVWYPSVTQFRETNGWDEVIERVGKNCREWVDQRRIPGIESKVA